MGLYLALYCLKPFLNIEQNVQNMESIHLEDDLKQVSEMQMIIL